MSIAAISAPIHGANTYHAAARRWSAQGIVGVVAGHVGVLGLLASLDVLPLPVPLATLMVQIIAPAPPAPLTPDITPPRPQPVERKPVFRPARPSQLQPQTLAAQAESPSAEVEVPVVTQAAPPPADPVPASAPAPAAPMTVTQARFDADYLQNPAPAYPALSRRMGEEGKVVLRVFVESTGRPSQIEIKFASGSPRLDQAAQEAVWRWKFVSARRGDEAVGAWVLVPIVFNLRG